jgi:hypothetical protein
MFSPIYFAHTHTHTHTQNPRNMQNHNDSVDVLSDYLAH